jgi:cell division protein ZapA (FtsZ GTPase activity inhibitor)
MEISDLSLDKNVTIELFGQAYTLKTDSEDGRAKEVADRLVREVRRIETEQSGKTPKMNKLAIMILTALNIANENDGLRTYYSDIIQNISMRSENLITVLDAGVPKSSESVSKSGSV